MSRIVPSDSLTPLSSEQRSALAAAYPDVERVLAAMRLARSVDACVLLLQGQPVDRGRLDPEAVEWAEARRLVQLRAPLELVNVPAEAVAA